MRTLLVLITGICIGLALAGRADTVRDCVELLLSWCGFIPAGAI